MKPSLLIFIALSAAALSSGQDVAPAPSPVPSKAATIVVPALKGIRLVPAAGTAGSTVEGIDLSALPVLQGNALRETLGARLGRPLRITDIDAMIREIKSAYAGLGRPFVEVMVPPQD